MGPLITPVMLFTGFCSARIQHINMHNFCFGSCCWCLVVLVGVGGARQWSTPAPLPPTWHMWTDSSMKFCSPDGVRFPSMPRPLRTSENSAWRGAECQGWHQQQLVLDATETFIMYTYCFQSNKSHRRVKYVLLAMTAAVSPWQQKQQRRQNRE